MGTIQERIQELRGLMAAFTVRPIDPGDASRGHLYFPFHKEPGQPRGRDPIADLRSTIFLSTANTTCQLFSGFQGTGKSTELRRLSGELQQLGFEVLLIEGARYINLYQPLEASDLLLSVAAAVGESVLVRLSTSGNIDSLFASPALLDELIAVSSGHIRDLFRLMQDVLREVVNQDDPRTPLGAPAVDLIAAEYVATCQKAIYTEDYAFLREVAATQRVRASNEAQIHRIAKLMDTQLVMIYRNGTEWFDVSTPVQRLLAAASAGGTG